MMEMARVVETVSGDVDGLIAKEVAVNHVSDFTRKTEERGLSGVTLHAVSKSVMFIVL